MRQNCRTVARAICQQRRCARFKFTRGTATNGCSRGRIFPRRVIRAAAKASNWSSRSPTMKSSWTALASPCSCQRSPIFISIVCAICRPNSVRRRTKKNRSSAVSLCGPHRILARPARKLPEKYRTQSQPTIFRLVPFAPKFPRLNQLDFNSAARLVVANRSTKPCD